VKKLALSAKIFFPVTARGGAKQAAVGKNILSCEKPPFSEFSMQGLMSWAAGSQNTP
jgi:hypothetical protein